MEDSFGVRVDKVFGSLPETWPYSVNSALWTLTDEEIQKKESNNDDDYPTFINSSDSKKPIQFDADDVDDDDDLDDDDVDLNNSKRNCVHVASGLTESNEENDDELEVRASIGLDPTLDHEDEEDEYDKVAIGKEKSGERLYMKDVNDYGSDVNDFHELPDGFNNVNRDPRANHLAAKLRLKEDSEAAAGFKSLELSETSQTLRNSLSNMEADITPLNNIGSGDYGNGGMADPKSILKNNNSGFKFHKRVDFEQQIDITSDAIRDQKQEATNLALNRIDGSLVPSSEITMDRSKYTHYTLESFGNVDEESNRNAYMDFLNSIKKPDATEMQLDNDFSKPPTFTPRKSYTVYGESKSKQNQGAVSNDRAFNICIAAGDVQDNTVSAMEEDDSMMVDASVPKSGRRYRTKSKINVE